MRYLFHLKFFLNETCNKRKRKKKRKGTRERERERGRVGGRGSGRGGGGGGGRGRGRIRGRGRGTEREEEEDKERERKGCFCKRFFFLLLAPGSALEKFAAIVNPENKPTKVNWTLSWPSALEICGKTVL